MAFFGYIWLICENPTLDRNNFNELVLGNQIRAFQQHQNKPQTDFPLSNDKIPLQSCSDQLTNSGKVVCLSV